MNDGSKGKSVAARRNHSTACSKRSFDDITARERPLEATNSTSSPSKKRCLDNRDAGRMDKMNAKKDSAAALCATAGVGAAPPKNDSSDTKSTESSDKFGLKKDNAEKDIGNCLKAAGVGAAPLNNNSDTKSNESSNKFGLKKDNAEKDIGNCSKADGLKVAPSMNNSSNTKNTESSSKFGMNKDIAEKGIGSSYKAGGLIVAPPKNNSADTKTTERSEKFGLQKDIAEKGINSSYKAGSLIVAPPKNNSADTKTTKSSDKFGLLKDTARKDIGNSSKATGLEVAPPMNNSADTKNTESSDKFSLKKDIAEKGINSSYKAGGLIVAPPKNNSDTNSTESSNEFGLQKDNAEKDIGNSSKAPGLEVAPPKNNLDTKNTENSDKFGLQKSIDKKDIGNSFKAGGLIVAPPKNNSADTKTTKSSDKFGLKKDNAEKDIGNCFKAAGLIVAPPKNNSADTKTTKSSEKFVLRKDVDRKDIGNSSKAGGPIVAPPKNNSATKTTKSSDKLGLRKDNAEKDIGNSSIAAGLKVAPPENNSATKTTKSSDKFGLKKDNAEKDIGNCFKAAGLKVAPPENNSDAKSTESSDKFGLNKDIAEKGIGSSYKAAGVVLSPPENNSSGSKGTESSEKFGFKKDIAGKNIGNSSNAAGLLAPPKNNSSDTKSTESSEKFGLQKDIAEKDIGSSSKAGGLVVSSPESNSSDSKSTKHSNKFRVKKDIAVALKAAVMAVTSSRNNCSDAKSSESSDKFGSKKDIGSSYKAVGLVVASPQVKHDMKSKESSGRMCSRENSPTNDKVTDIAVSSSESKYSAFKSKNSDSGASKEDVDKSKVAVCRVAPIKNKCSEFKKAESSDKFCSKRNSGTTFKDTDLAVIASSTKTETVNTKDTGNSKKLDPKKNVAFDLQVSIERCKNIERKSTNTSDSLSLKKDGIKDTGLPYSVGNPKKTVDTSSEFCATKGSRRDSNDKRDPKVTFGQNNLRDVKDKNAWKSIGDIKEDRNDRILIGRDQKGKESSVEKSTGDKNEKRSLDKENFKDSSKILDDKALVMKTNFVKDRPENGDGPSVDKIRLSMQKGLKHQEMKLTAVSVGDTTVKISDDKRGDKSQHEEDAIKISSLMTNSSNNSTKKGLARTSYNKSLTKEGVPEDMSVSKKSSAQQKKGDDRLTVMKGASIYIDRKMSGITNLVKTEQIDDEIDDSSKQVVGKESTVHQDLDDKRFQEDLCNKRPMSSFTPATLTNLSNKNNKYAMESFFTTNTMKGSLTKNKVCPEKNYLNGELEKDACRIEQISEYFSSIQNENREPLPARRNPDKMTLNDNRVKRNASRNEEMAIKCEGYTSKKNNNTQVGGNVFEIVGKLETVVNTVKVEQASLIGQTHISESEHKRLTSNDANKAKIRSNATNEVKNVSVTLNPASGGSQPKNVSNEKVLSFRRRNPSNTKSRNVKKTIVEYVEDENGELIMTEHFAGQKNHFDEKNNAGVTRGHLQKIPCSNGAKSSITSFSSSTSQNSPYFKTTVGEKNEEKILNSLVAADLQNNNASYAQNTSSIVKNYASSINKDTPLHYDQSIAQNNLFGMTQNISNGGGSSLQVRNIVTGTERVQKLKFEEMSQRIRNYSHAMNLGIKPVAKVEKMSPPKGNSKENCLSRGNNFQKINSISASLSVPSGVERIQNLSKPIRCGNADCTASSASNSASMEKLRKPWPEGPRLVQTSRPDLLVNSQNTYSKLYSSYEPLSLPIPSHTSLQSKAQKNGQLSQVNQPNTTQENATGKRKNPQRNESKNQRKKRLRRERQNQQFRQRIEQLNGNFHDIIHLGLQSQNPAVANGGTAGTGSHSASTNGALVGKRQRNDEPAVRDGKKRRKCPNQNGQSAGQSNDKVAGVSKAAEKISVKEEEKEARRQQQANAFILKKIERIEKVCCTVFKI